MVLIIYIYIYRTEYYKQIFLEEFSKNFGKRIPTPLQKRTASQNIKARKSTTEALQPSTYKMSGGGGFIASKRPTKYRKV